MYLIQRLAVISKKAMVAGGGNRQGGSGEGQRSCLSDQLQVAQVLDPPTLCASRVESTWLASLAHGPSSRCLSLLALREPAHKHSALPSAPATPPPPSSHHQLLLKLDPVLTAAESPSSPSPASAPPCLHPHCQLTSPAEPPPALPSGHADALGLATLQHPPLPSPSSASSPCAPGVSLWLPQGSGLL